MRITCNIARITNGKVLVDDAMDNPDIEPWFLITMYVFNIANLYDVIYPRKVITKDGFTYLDVNPSYVYIDAITQRFTWEEHYMIKEVIENYVERLYIKSQVTP